MIYQYYDTNCSKNYASLLQGWKIRVEGEISKYRENYDFCYKTGYSGGF